MKLFKILFLILFVTTFCSSCMVQSPYQRTQFGKNYQHDQFKEKLSTVTIVNKLKSNQSVTVAGRKQVIEKKSEFSIKVEAGVIRIKDGADQIDLVCRAGFEHVYYIIAPAPVNLGDLWNNQPTIEEP